MTAFADLRRVVLRRPGWILPILMGLPSWASTAETADVVLLRQGKPSVVIPSSGMWYAEDEFKRATAISRQEASINAYVKSKVPEEKRANVVSALEEVRLAAAHETATAIEYSRSVSSPSASASAASASVKEKKFQAADSLMKWIDSMTAAGPPTVDFPTTKIVASPAGTYVLHYKGILQYTKDQGASGWSSYTEGDKLRIGLYMFRIRQPSGGESVLEQVGVWDEPTTKMINVNFKSP